MLSAGKGMLYLLSLQYNRGHSLLKVFFEKQFSSPFEFEKRRIGLHLKSIFSSAENRCEKGREVTSHANLFAEP